MSLPLVRGGEDARLPPDKKSGEPLHTWVPVYTEALLTICREYPGLPDPRTLTMDEIEFFYEGLRPELKRTTSPKNKPKPPPRPPRGGRTRR